MTLNKNSIQKFVTNSIIKDERWFWLTVMEYKSKEVTGFFELSIILEKFNILIYPKSENILSILVVSNTRLKCFCEFSKIQLCFFLGGGWRGRRARRGKSSIPKRLWNILKNYVKLKFIPTKYI